MTCLEHQRVLLIEEIRDRVTTLKSIGVSSIEMKELVSYIMDGIKPDLSRMIITKDYKIMLPDYNKEITLNPLSKAIYLLYLKHEEGIPFKMLSDYKKELEDIYMRISSRTDLPSMKVSIANLVNPLNNSINEKCSVIKSSFAREVDVWNLKQYIITGSKGSSRKILLDRSLIQIESII